MICHIDLKYNKGFSWFSDKTIHCKGYAFDQAGHFIHDSALLKYFSDGLANSLSFENSIKSLNGIFTVVYNDGKRTLIYCDKSRFFPVFYRIGKELFITDEPRYLVRSGDSLNPLSVAEFRCTGIVSGKETLVNNLYQAQAGCILVFDKEMPEIKTLFSQKVKPEEISSDTDPSGKLTEKLEEAFQRLADSLKGYTPVLPLSGGFDSRLIACMLKKHGFDNTICFTYGRNNKEVELSKKVAEKLGFTWYFVNYPEFIKEWDITNDTDFHDYYHFASHFTSMFYLQEYPAMKYLMKNSLIPENSVFIPGHSGDLLAGSHFIKAYPVNLKPEHAAESIISGKYTLYPYTGEEFMEFINKINTSVGPCNNYLGYSVYEDWYIKERIAKFIFNSSQVFTFYNYPVRFPFWDDELVEFFRCLPASLRINKKLYDSVLKKNYFERYDVNFGNELTVSKLKLRLQAIKDLLKSYLPQKVLKNRIIKHDWICYYEMSSFMMEELDKKQHNILPHENYNSILINWYIQKISEPDKIKIE